MAYLPGRWISETIHSSGGHAKQMTAQISVGRVRGISTSFYVQPSWKLDEKVRQVEGARAVGNLALFASSTAGMGGDRKHPASDIDEAAGAKQYPLTEPLFLLTGPNSQGTRTKTTEVWKSTITYGLRRLELPLRMTSTPPRPAAAITAFWLPKSMPTTDIAGYCCCE